MSTKYYLSYHGMEKQVTKKEWIQAERGAGFRSKFGDDYEATGGFTAASGIQGRIEFR